VLKSLPMQASEFIRKWSPGGSAHELTERAGAQAHDALAAVAAAYGWADGTPAMADDEILRRLLALNQERSVKAGAASHASR
jgi:hypothetical protein